MNLLSLIEFLAKAKKDAIVEHTCEDLAYDDDTVIQVELSFEEVDEIVEILSAYYDAVEDEEWDDEE